MILRYGPIDLRPTEGGIRIPAAKGDQSSSPGFRLDIPEAVLSHHRGNGSTDERKPILKEAIYRSLW
ncbi:unnamed protein product [Dovyalis caffra]|uniref:Uncharacterized protein n=1 Tax=Dovyalis caffra TaxID=77055 RepID=A0AAV1R6L5_9ROSI|nr:unnamed protein product [Dovyalis caffra]